MEAFFNIKGFGREMSCLTFSYRKYKIASTPYTLRIDNNLIQFVEPQKSG